MQTALSVLGYMIFTENPAMRPSRDKQTRFITTQAEKIDDDLHGYIVSNPVQSMKKAQGRLQIKMQTALSVLVI
ncbi:hypothetical protein D0T90_09905 [Neisseria animalis]|uniref:Uncharacterized protein n=1 Tax=Neisseria animalis TaxID=492 RepID=A0A5P3MUJ3_NEIAN|nr:hypothetical protein D0T90_09905 [Neisseria animalis]ROW31862.1 hypothetical protein CGZ60_08265 [Neisseria animalis]VEE07825.1 Uncharacterised protein [Neisseria animalis]